MRQHRAHDAEPNKWFHIDQPAMFSGKKQVSVLQSPYIWQQSDNVEGVTLKQIRVSRVFILVITTDKYVIWGKTHFYNPVYLCHVFYLGGFQNSQKCTFSI